MVTSQLYHSGQTELCWSSKQFPNVSGLTQKKAYFLLLQSCLCVWATNSPCAASLSQPITALKYQHLERETKIK